MIKTNTIKIANYQALKLIHDSSRTEVYRGYNVENGQPVIIKLMRNQYPSFRELVQFRNQYAISKNLEIEGIIKTYTLQRYENRYAIIMQDMGGISLAEYEGKSSFSMPQFLDIAIQLSEILHQLHKNSIIHKDIKPANILIHPETKQVKLIDFSISSLLPKETQTVQTPNVLEGTLAYLSPEQTGRMNRGIDYRSDFYALGVTFYELLIGDVPFSSNDALELIHAHIAVSPDPLNNWVVLGGDLCPPILSNIVLKLMAKNAEYRYQSALGLKYDLEKCRKQWEETGKIEFFELGERDICDRFIIPDKLYGRETEVKELLDSFERVAEGNREMMLVVGFSGIGKTAVVNEVHKPIVRQRGYFIKGKFDQFNRNIPFSAVVQAFRSLMGQLLSESDSELQQWKAKILEAVGESGQVLIEVIPELEQIIGQQPDVPELSGSAAQNRFNLLFQKFIAVFTTKEHPLVMFLDDLQWADSASLNLLKLLMGESETGYLLVLGAYRDNEVFPAHPLMLTLEDIRKHQAQIQTLTLKPLATEHIHYLVADTLLCSIELAAPLAELVYQKTQGNPFFATQFLQGLYQDGCISFEATARYWQCNFAQVRQLALTDDVVEFMVGRLQKLPEATQEVLKLAACIGNQFDLATLAIVSETNQEYLADDLWRVLQEGLVIPENETYKFFQGDNYNTENIENISVSYRFLHDRVQQAGYLLIPPEQKQATHLKIGRLLLNKTSATELDETLFEIVNQFNVGQSLVTDLSEKIQLVELNLKAAQKARVATAYVATYQYATTGIDLLTSPQLEQLAWQAHYDLALPLHELAAETAYLSGDMAEMEQWAEIVLQQVNSAVDKMGVYSTKIQAYMAQAKKIEALNIGFEALELLGVSFPESPTPADIEQTLAQTASNLQGKKIEDIIHLPVMTDGEKLAIAKMLLSLGSPSFQAARSFFPLVICALVNLSLEYGNSPFSGYGYACYSVLLEAIFQDSESAYKFGQLALNISQKFNALDMKSSVCMPVGASTIHIKAHVKETLPILQEGYQSGLEGGSFEFMGYAAVHKCQYSYISGQELSSLESEMAAISETLSRFKQNNALAWNQTFHQAVINLLYPSENLCNLEGAAYSEKSSLPQLQGDNHRSEIYYVYLNKLILSYLFGDYLQAQENALKAEQYLDAVEGFLITFISNFYDSLAHLAVCSSIADSQLDPILNRVTSNQEKMKQWATNAPMNYQHKWDLVEAERCRVLGKSYEAFDLYDRAIAGAKENEYIQEEALANELAAKFYLEWGKEKFAALYLQEAYYCYAQWGAKAKNNDLEQGYPELLKPLLQQNIQSLSSNISISQITSNSHHQTATVANISSILDFSSLLKASQTLSGEIELDRLLSTIIKIILENAGATKSALLLSSETGLTIEAIATRTEDSSQLTIDSLNQSIPLEENIDLPVGLINYVRRTTETVLLDGKAAQQQFAADNYLLSFHPQSLLSIPLLERGKLIGILYLENSLTADAFTSERVEILDTLCAQAAISLENARLYQQAQQALKDLQEAQLQLVQNEKMVTLGNLVAGVAHEINNPVGFIGGNIHAALEHLQDLLNGLSLYQKYASIPNEIIEEIEELDLDFVATDFPKLMASMQEGVERIADISTSLRTFSRTDTTSKIEFNLHDGIDSTLLILKYRLKATENRPAIEIIKNYGDIPLVKCYVGQLNQVFMNLFANAIDALDEGNTGKTFQEIEKEPNRITLETELDNDRQSVIIRISDNGTGMPEEVKAKIFQQGFTTKEVGKGTGLGMAIAHQIVTEKHGGKISCDSRVGQGTIFTIIIPR